MKFEKTNLGEMLAFFNGKAVSVDADGEFPVYGSNGVIGNAKNYLYEDSIILGRVGAYCGSVERCKSKFWASDNTIVVKTKEGYDVDFAYYLLLHFPLNAFAGGAAQPLITQTILKGIDVLVPDVITQKRIAEILSAYDDLIENNLKRIRLLEESARLLYREWFVRLKFPNHEHTPLIDGLPEGWRMGNVGDLAKVQSGFAFKSSDWLPDGNPVIKIKNLIGNTINLDGCECVSDEVAEKAARFLLKEGDLLFAMSGATVGKFALMLRSQNKYYLNQRVGILRPISDLNPNPFLFTFLNSENAQQQVKNFASGAAQPNISPGQIEAIKLLLPSEKVLKDYLEFCEPIFKQKNSLLEQNQKLKQARDLLLPRLMSGEIAV